MSEGYPFEYVLSRVHGRRARLLQYSRVTEESRLPKLNFKRELYWIYKILSPGDKRRLWPFLGYFFLELFIPEVRVAWVQKKTILLKGEFLELFPSDILYSEGPWQKIEHALRKSYLEGIIESKTKEPIKGFFVELIDLRNHLLLVKHRYWKKKGLPFSLRKDDFIKGGKKMFKEIETVDPYSAERALFKRLMGYLRSAARDPAGDGLVMEYLFRYYLIQKNLEVRHRLMPIYGESIKRDLIEV